MKLPKTTRQELYKERLEVYNREAHLIAGVEKPLPAGPRFHFMQLRRRVNHALSAMAFFLKPGISYFC
jgi:hypothetical protein